MDDKYAELDLYQLTDYVKNKWSVWYQDNGICIMLLLARLMG